MVTIAAPPSLVRITMQLATRDTAITAIGILVALLFSSAPAFDATARTFLIRSFCNIHVLRDILLNGDVFLDALVVHSKGDCDQDQEGQEKTCAAMKHGREVDLLFG
ncbi:unnamed protein product [Chondrus crispus]|uniref:Uncharacterized protein n=1 Tax=Chondrus crispus TaxID=2769 RepID=R7QF93_CHOCR|nr:unnamed protein product [Chondrus crispus]CDF36111.1 unnamed protein product [Chondrus crispus]|eukprot:XP_005715930.1 unnamed protein product [Chondrus crispus]